jgi:tetratricopeptide (TPR) repeat protein
MAKGELHLLYLKTNQRDKAKKAIEDAIKDSNVPDHIYFDYAMFLENEGNIDEAIVQLERVYQRNQEHHVVHQLARLKHLNRQYLEAIPLYYKIAEDIQNPIAIYAAIGECHFHLKQYVDCACIACVLLLREPENGDWWENLVVSLRLLGKIHLISKLQNPSQYASFVGGIVEILNELEN